MKKLILPILLFFLSGVVWTLCAKAKQDLVFGLGVYPPASIDWNEKFPNYMRIRKLLPSRWDDYPSLFEKCFLHPQGKTEWTDKESLNRVKTAIALSGIMGEMRGYLSARQFEAIVLMGLSIIWVFAIIRRDNKRAEQSGAGYPPQGVGSPDP